MDPHHEADKMRLSRLSMSLLSAFVALKLPCQASGTLWGSARSRSTQLPPKAVHYGTNSRGFAPRPSSYPARVCEGLLRQTFRHASFEMDESQGIEAMAMEMKQPRLAASTYKTFSCSIIDSKAKEKGIKVTDINTEQRPPSQSFRDLENLETNYFKNVQWSPDGTCLFTNSADNILRTFVVPTSLLDSHESPIPLEPYTNIDSPEPVYAYTTYPHFILQDSSTTLLLSSHRDHSTRLTNILDPSATIISTYPLTSPTTEAYLTPHSLAFLPSGTQFLAGTESLITLHDLSRNGEGPVTRLPTIPSRRHKIKGGGVGMRGIISTLALQPSSASTIEAGDDSGILAAGTWTRWVSLYDACGMGGTISNFSIEAAAQEAGIGGSGVSQVTWSRCGRYLIITERKSDGCLVFDVRVTGKLVAWCEGRRAITNQRMTVDCFGGPDGASEIWAGGTDGIVRIWERVGMQEGAINCDWNWKANDEVVSGVAVHPSGTVVATSSGSRQELNVGMNWDSEDSGCDSDNGSSGDVTDDEEEEEEEERNSCSGTNTSSATPTSSRTSSSIVRSSVDNSTKIWSLI